MTPAGKWILGCSLGCGVFVVLIVVAVIGGSAWVLKDMTGDLEAAVESREALEAQMGTIADYVPPATGALPADRVETFLAVRGAIAEPRRELAEVFEKLNVDPEKVKHLEHEGGAAGAKFAWHMIKNGFSLPSAMGGFFDARNAALLEHGMGLGEYTWVYSMAYFAALEHPVGEASPLSDVQTSEGRHVRVTSDLFDRETSSRVRDDLLGMLRRTREASADESWRLTLDTEIERMESDPDRMPWQDGLPDSIAESLRPFLERLDADFDEMTHGIDLAVQHKTGNMSYTLR
ncbi:MAG: hypothetical protein GY716_17620 [bacterium]|nr:hypothetical protein [bacterium]